MISGPNPQNYGKRQLAARPLAFFFATSYVVVAAAVGTLLLRPDEPPSTDTATTFDTTAADSTTTTRRAATTVPRTTTTSSTPRLPAGFRQVSGPYQLRTVLPDRWRVTTGSVATTLVASDPDDPRRDVRFGGAPVTDTSTDLAGRIGKVDAERRSTAGYRRTSLESSRFHGFPAMRWDYEYLKDGAPKQVTAFYWEAQGIEYVIYAATSPEDWSTVRSLAETMKDHASP